MLGSCSRVTCALLMQHELNCSYRDVPVYFVHTAAAAALLPACCSLQHELNCSYQGVPIDCLFTLNVSRFATADGMYFHTPGTPQVGNCHGHNLLEHK
jgi:hypothetical protein